MIILNVNLNINSFDVDVDVELFSLRMLDLLLIDY